MSEFKKCDAEPFSLFILLIPSVLLPYSVHFFFCFHSSLSSICSINGVTDGGSSSGSCYSSSSGDSGIVIGINGNCVIKWKNSHFSELKKHIKSSPKCCDSRGYRPSPTELLIVDLFLVSCSSHSWNQWVLQCTNLTEAPSVDSGVFIGKSSDLSTESLLWSAAISFS